jgi:2'-5' RNA ligase
VRVVEPRRSGAAPPAGRIAIETVRSFVALLLDDAVRQALAAEIDRLRPRAPGVSWVAPENLHLTLKFLGSVATPGIDAIGSALAAAAAESDAFDLTVQGVGAFPSPARARVIWAGSGNGVPAATALAGRVDAALAPLGFAPEDRPFTAHITLGRVRGGRPDPALAEALAAAAARPFGVVHAARVSLMRSDLSPRGSRYTELAGWPLRPRGA